jgi:4-hydroxy-3-methylbut-2-enyl diphosphate reductase
MTIHVGTLLALPANVRTVVFVGTRSSDHLRELMRMAEFRGRIAYRIEQAAELQPRWFVGVEEVGVVLGASDLQPVLRAVTERLGHFGEAQTHGMLEGVAT